MTDFGIFQPPYLDCLASHTLVWALALSTGGDSYVKKQGTREVESVSGVCSNAPYFATDAPYSATGAPYVVLDVRCEAVDAPYFAFGANFAASSDLGPAYCAL